MTDRELLEKYVKTGSQEPFAQLVRSHIDVVYSAARRQTKGDAALAEEVTQQVFILLAQKAKSLPPGVLLGGWLFNSVRFIARDVVRKEQRRALHEQKAGQMAHDEKRAAATPHNASWSDAEAVLDEAMADLDEPSRGLLVLKYFEGKTAREVGAALGITEEAARKRVSRAVDELRDLFERRGVVMSSAFLADALIANAVTQAPAHLAASATSAAAAATVATPASAATAVSSASLFTAVHAKVAAVVVASLLAVGGGVQAVRHFAPKREITITPQRPVISGTVKNPDGQPARRCEIVISTNKLVIGAYEKARKNRMAADELGKYSLEQPAGPFVLIFRNDAGYSERSGNDLATSADVQLQAWGRVEGVVTAAGKPVANVPVILWLSRGPEYREYNVVYHQTTTRADGAGKFLFPRVVPGEVWIADRAADNSRSLRHAYAVVDPGQTAHVTIGGSGRSLVGKFTAPPTTRPIWLPSPGPYYYEADIRPWPYERLATTRPAHKQDESLADYRAAEEAFGKTPDGQKFKSWTFGWSFLVNPDGSFRIDDVPPGQYVLTSNNMELNDELRFLDTFAHARQTIEVPEARPGDGPLDLGEIKLTVVPRLKRGEDVPPFDFVTLDGKTRDITALRGTNVLLISWFENGDAATIEKYKQVQARWRDDPRLAVIWLSIESPDAARRAAEKLGLAGTIATSGRQGIPEEYGASATGAILIDAGGKFVQRHLHRDVVEKYLDKTIGNPPPPLAKAQGPQPTAPVLQTTPSP